MAVQVTMKFNPAGFAECLEGMSGIVESKANEIAEEIVKFAKDKSSGEQS